MNELDSVAARYRSFAVTQAADSSPSLHAWALGVADDGEALARLGGLPVAKQQPNLVFAAARVHGAVPGDVASLVRCLRDDWAAVRETILARSTQTNEAARCAALVLGLEPIEGPVALLELGAAAGLCLIPDRYSYRFGAWPGLDPADGPSDVVIPLSFHGTPPARLPEVVWRRGVDLLPLDPGDPEDLAWLRSLVWPEREPRRRRLEAAAALAAREQVEVVRADLREGLERFVADVPRAATLVVTHSATLAYLEEADRRRVAELVAATGARRISFEGRGVDPLVAPVSAAVTVETAFVAALDGQPYALGDGHCRRLVALAPGA